MDRLKTILFSDLIIGEKRSYLKNVPDEQLLLPLPEILKKEVGLIKQELLKIDKNEFLFIFDGIQYRVSKLKSLNETLYILRKAVEEIPTLQELGFPQSIIKLLCLEKRNKGLCLFSGKMGSGKTTSASSLIKARLSIFGGHAITLEDPPELPLENEYGGGKGVCFQRDITGQSLGLSIVETMRHASPEIIFLGELRTSDGVSQALRAAINGHLIVATIHASGVIETLRRLIALSREKDGDAAESLLSEGFSCVIHQNLVRNPKRLEMQFLFREEKSSIDAKIRNGQLEQLVTDIQSQRNRILMGI